MKKVISIVIALTMLIVGASQVSAAGNMELIGKYTTSLKGSTPNRVSNIKLAAKKISGTVLQPNQTFSFNGKVGNSNIAKNGWKLATVIVNKRKVNGYGGGICQVSSTLFNAVDQARLKVVKRYAHSVSVGYVPKGRDATVAWGSKDFVFKNTSGSKIQIQAIVWQNQVIVKVFKYKG